MTDKNGAQGVAAEASTGGSLISDAKLRQLYTAMLHCRLLSEHAASVRPKARVDSPFAASAGQEAVAAGWVTDLLPNDTIALATGDSIASLVKGVPISELIAQLHAMHRGVDDRIAAAAHNVIPAFAKLEKQCDAIAATAFANKRRKKSPVVVSFLSTATMALPPWHNLLTLAAKEKLPIVFVVENNPRSGNAVDNDFSQKARDYGLLGIPVDGNDVVAVYRVAFESLDRVRHGDGPVMAESRTYSVAGKGGRALERDPLAKMERYLKAKKLFSTKWKEQLVESFSKDLKKAAKAALTLTA